MKQEDKELLIKDLASRVPYGVKCQVFDDATPYTLSGVLPNKPYDELYFEQMDFKECDGFAGVKFCKPYLFPLSSMTEEQEEEWDNYFVNPLLKRIKPHTRKEDFMLRAESAYSSMDFLLKNHFDYLGLLDKGLAIDCTNLNIY